jgi:uncharacterized protein (DUF924 family)
MTANPSPSDILAFWVQAGEKAWFSKDPAFDQAIRSRFEAAHFAAARGALEVWDTNATGALALVLLLDQFPRNMYRDTAHAFATDPLARKIARRAVAAAFDKVCDPRLRYFFYLPFEHSENVVDQAFGIRLYEALGDAELLKWARIHADIIAKFGRFPHRNACLGRTTTPEEQTFLNQGGFAG